MTRGYRVPLTLERQPDGGFVVTSPAIPELLTEGDTVQEAMANAEDAFAAVLEIYEDEGKELPAALSADLSGSRIDTERLLATG